MDLDEKNRMHSPHITSINSSRSPGKSNDGSPRCSPASSTSPGRFSGSLSQAEVNAHASPFSGSSTTKVFRSVGDVRPPMERSIIPSITNYNNNWTNRSDSWQQQPVQQQRKRAGMGFTRRLATNLGAQQNRYAWRGFQQQNIVCKYCLIFTACNFEVLKQHVLEAHAIEIGSHKYHDTVNKRFLTYQPFSGTHNVNQHQRPSEEAKMFVAPKARKSLITVPTAETSTKLAPTHSEACQSVVLQSDLRPEPVKSEQDEKITEYKCPCCLFQAEAYQTVKKHLKTHDDTPFRCTHCKFSCDSQKVLEFHLSRKHQVYSVNETPQQISNVVRIDLALKQGKSLRCRKCGFSTQDRVLALSHRPTECTRLTSPLETNDRIQDMSDTQPPSDSQVLIEQLPSQLQSADVEDKPAVSDVLELKTDEGKEGISSTERPSSPTDENESQIPDTEKEKKPSLPKLKHRRDKDGNKLYKCPDCPYETSSKIALLEMHFPHHNSNEKFKCKLCSYASSKQAIIQYHESCAHDVEETKVEPEPKSSPAETAKKLGLKKLEIKIKPSEKENEKEKVGEKRKGDEADDDAGRKKVKMDAEDAKGKKNEEGGKIEEGEKGQIDIIITKDGKKRVHSCRFCPFKHHSIIVVEKHIANHYLTSKEAPIQCEFCTYRCKSISALKNHTRVHEDSIPVHVDFKSNNILDAKIVKVGGQFTCPHCPTKNKNREVIVKHFRHHDMVGAMFPCTKCSFRTNKYKVLNKHLAIHKKAEMKILSDNTAATTLQTTAGMSAGCSKWKAGDPVLAEQYGKQEFDESTLTWEEDTEYMTCSEHELALLGWSDWPYKMQCHVKNCNYRPQVKNKRSLLIHLKHHSLNFFNELKCELCTYTSNNQATINHHVAVVHKDTPRLYCTDCPFRSLVSETMLKHWKCHHRDLKGENYKCNLCSYRCQDEEEINEHITVHRKHSYNIVKAKPKVMKKREVNVESVLVDDDNITGFHSTSFHCNSCPFKCHDSVTLIIHQRMHAHKGEHDKIRCNKCDFTCADDKSLEKHVEFHYQLRNDFYGDKILRPQWSAEKCSEHEKPQKCHPSVQETDVLLLSNGSTAIPKHSAVLRCQFCSRKFSRRTEFILHEATHIMSF